MTVSSFRHSVNLQQGKWIKSSLEIIKIFETVLREQTVDGLERIRRAYTTYWNSPLPTNEDKLLFILVYLKQAPTQTLHGQLFGLSQSNANKWIHLLHRVLNHALATEDYLPARRSGCACAG